MMDATTLEKYKATPFYALEIDGHKKCKQFMEYVQQEYDWLTEVLKEIPAMLPQDEFMVLPAKTPGKRKARAVAKKEPPKFDLEDSGDPPSVAASIVTPEQAGRPQRDAPLTIDDLESEPKSAKTTGRALRSLRSRTMRTRVSMSKKKANTTKKLSSHSRACTYSPRHVRDSPSASSTPERREGDKRKQRTLRLKRTATVKRLFLTPDKRKMYEESLSSLRVNEQSRDEIIAGLTNAESSESSVVPNKVIPEEVGMNKMTRNALKSEGRTKVKEPDISETDLRLSTEVGHSTMNNYVTAIESPEKLTPEVDCGPINEQPVVKECRVVLKPLSPSLLKQLVLFSEDVEEDKSSSPLSDREEVVLSRPTRTSTTSVPTNETVVLSKSREHSSQAPSSVPESAELLQPAGFSKAPESANEMAVESKPATTPPEVSTAFVRKENFSIMDDSPGYIPKDSEHLVSSTPEERERCSARQSRKRSNRQKSLPEAVVMVKKIVVEGEVGSESLAMEADEVGDDIAPLAVPVPVTVPQTHTQHDSFITDDEWDTIDDESVSVVNHSKASISTPQHSRPRNGLIRLAHSADGAHRLKKIKKWKTYRKSNLNSSADKFQQKSSNLSRISNTSTPGRLQKRPSERLSEIEEEKRRELTERMKKEARRLKEREERLAKEREARRLANEKRRKQVLSKREASRREKIDALRQQVEERDRHHLELLREKEEEEQRRKAALAVLRRQQEEREREEAERKLRRQRDELEKKRAREEAERRQKEAEKKAKEEAERRQKEAEKKAKEEAEWRSKEAEKKAKEEAERRQKEAEKKVKEEAERRQEAEKKAKEEAERRQKELERKAREEAEKKAKEDAERRVKCEAERRARIEAEKRAREEAYKRAQEEERRLMALKHQQQMSVLKTSSRMNIPDSAPAKPKKFSSSDHYDISDLHSDQETDDDEKPRKKVPSWASRSAMLSLCRHVRQQETKWWIAFRPSDTIGVDLGQMFSESTRAFRNRTSSAVWDIPPALRSNRPYL